MSESSSDNESEGDAGSREHGDMNLKGDPVEIIVGNEKASFFAHEAMLRKSSEFFDAALKKEWEEGQKRTISLPDDDPDLVYSYIWWLYARKLFVKTTNTQGEPAFAPLARLYVLGEKLLDDDFQDNVLSKLFAPTFADSPWWPNERAIDIIYAGTTSGSPARQLLIDSWVRHGHDKWIDRNSEGCWKVHDDFKTDLCQALLKNCMLRGDKRANYHALETQALCAYHKHGREESCTVAK